MVVDDVAGAVGPTLPPGEVREVFEALAPRTGVALALVARGRTVGAMSVYRAADRLPADPEDVATLRELADRTALALDNLRLYEQQRRMAEDLQRSLLTDPVQPERAQIAVRYSPAVRAAHVGGDWYDAFLQPDGATMLVIGDVVGHDTEAAAAMGQVRGLLRGISYSSGDTPSEVLSRVDRAVRGLDLDTMATATVARLESDGDGDTYLRWANAGHPPPVYISASGQVELLDGKPADLLLGVSPDFVREDHVTPLAVGDTVLLYTDGLVERRDRDIDAGTKEMLDVLAEFAHLPLAEVCDRVLERLFLPDAQDDVAILAVRLLPRDDHAA
jgi:serine phosphatase RsbU (regulator of sigma subunit)